MDGVLLLKIAGEIATKSARTRRRFLRVLARNVRAALRRAGVRGAVEPRWSRLVVRTDDPERAGRALSAVFGLHSVSEAHPIPPGSLDELVKAAAAASRERVRGRTFAVRVKRSGDHPFRSPDVATALGTALLPDSAGVDLDDPEVTVRVEASDGEAFVLLDGRPGPGGLPVGVGGRVLSLFSGGFDSPVATWMAMRRGMSVDLLVFDLGGCAQVDAALEVARELATRWGPGVEPAAHVVDLAPVVSALRDRVDPGIRQVLLKRSMYRAGTVLARRLGCEALVTGEALGQVSTQTLRNLTVADEAAGVPVLRPLVGMDKEEIIGRARTIGTHDASERVQEHCAISTGRVDTAAKLGQVLTAEGRIDESFIHAAVDGSTSIDLLGWTPGPPPGHVIEDIPEGAVVVDVREPGEGEVVGDVRLPFSRVAEWGPGLDPERTYVFVCSHGNRSEMVAHDLRARGMSAYSLAGGAGRVPTRAA
ncbi:MAG TPA: tRNA uracil 4-sulfurtransferase ThiI [Actinomycetota bacterium]|nr:tRNA uracil 4-sulfurtransferase ThiI [Actinomycetota bacterium]